MADNVKRIREIADRVARELKANGFHVLRYDSYSTNSVYLKLDYGVMHSIRISDHSGKKHLGYRYNVLSTCQQVTSGKTAQGYPRYFYPFDQTDRLVRDIIHARTNMMVKYHNNQAIYNKFMAQNKARGEQARTGFWVQAKEV